MTKPSPEIEKIAALAEQRLEADESRITGSRRTNVSLGDAGRSFWRAPSPWLLSAYLVAAVVARITVGGGALWELLIPVTLIALFPLIEWVIHVAILHWRPRRIGPIAIDSLLARKHREHHADPRDIPLVFIPWPVLVWLLPLYVGGAWLFTPTWASALTVLVSIYATMIGYEWTHYLIHSDYKPKSSWYRAVWRNHRLHHYKNEHYWFTVTSSGTADRLLGTYPDPETVKSSKTVKKLHATETA